MQVWDNEPEDSFDEINIIPMIDVIFAILTFFILSTLFLTQAEEFPVNLPETETSQEKPEANFVVVIEEGGDILLDSQPTRASRLDNIIRGRLEPGQEAIVSIQADQRAYHGQVIEVMDVLRTVEGVRLGIATAPKSE
ncbi:MAG: biopolymer transporter ExbD [Cyanobacteria bacterium P01_E01_bin.42]